MKLRELLNKTLGINGRLISYSKGAYMDKHPQNTVIFNGNVISKKGKIWYGDIDLTLESEKLQKIANESGESFHILREMDGRFENENISFESAAVKSQKTFIPQK